MDAKLWLVLCGAGALLVRAGLAFYATGTARSKNAAGAALRNACDLCVAVLAFWAMGQHLAPMLHIHDQPGHAEAFFQTAVVLVASGIFAGAVAERSKFVTVAAASLLIAGIVTPLGMAWVREGFLERMGAIDVGGATFVHLAGAVFAAVGAVMVGPRMNKFNRDGSSNVIPGHSVPLAAVGVMLMLAGWVPYVVGSNGAAHAGSAALNVLLAGAAGGVASLFYGQIRYGKPDVYLTYSGLLGALVAVTACAGAMEGYAAIVVGLAAGIVVPFVTILLEISFRLDDPSGGVAIHGAGGACGALLGAVLANGTAMDRLHRLGAHALAIVVVAALAAGVAIVAMIALRATLGLRSKEADEFDGLDLAEHDINAYPDFQQTMIKSFHLREA